MLSKAIHHARNREYMSGIERDQLRVKATYSVEDFLGQEIDMNFDVIVGNPPFHVAKNGEKRDSAANLWPMFVDTAMRLLKINGYLGFITPTGWITPSADIGKGDTGIRIYNYMTKYHTIVLNVGDFKKYFTNSTTFSYYIIQKTENTDQKETLIITKSEEFLINLSAVKYFPSIVNETSLSINAKVLKGTPIGFSNNNTVDSKKFEKNIGDNSTVKRITRCYHSSANKGTYKYSAYVGPEVFAKKVMVCSSGNYLPIYDDGELGFTSKTYVYYLQANETLDAVKSYIGSKLVSVLLSQNKTSGWISYAFRLLPKLDLTKKWSDKELYKHFKLTQEEIDYIETNVK